MCISKVFGWMITLACVMSACRTDDRNCKEMATLSFDESQAAAMTVAACQGARGDLHALAGAIGVCFDTGLTANQMKETFSQLYAYAGFPRSLNALGVLQEVMQQRGIEAEGPVSSPLPAGYDALKQGTEVQTRLSGQPFDYDFSPVEDYYLKAHLFGDIFARDLLTHADRELVTVSALSGMEGTEPQLAAHVRGAMNMGVTEAQLLAIPKTLQERVGKMEAHRVAVAIQQTGIRDSLNDILAAAAYIRDYVDLKSYWRRGDPNTAYAQYFTGHSYLAPYAGGMVNVSFEPGCRNNWHIHHGAVQVLVCVYGRGWYQAWGEAPVELKPGVVIEIPEGVKHWHGAAADSWMQHLTYHVDAKPENHTEWLEPVDDLAYDKLK